MKKYLFPKIEQSDRRKFVIGGNSVGTMAALLAGGASAAGAAPVAIALTAVGALGFSLSGHAYLRPLRNRKFEKISVRDANYDDLVALQEEIEEYNPNAVPLIERDRIRRKNRLCFRVIDDRREQGKVSEKLEVIATYPLLKGVSEKIISGQMVGADIRAEHIHSDYEKADSLYIAFVRGENPTTRGFARAELDKMIVRIRKRPLTLFGIPTREQALLGMTASQFQKRGGGDPELDEMAIGILKSRTPRRRR